MTPFENIKSFYLQHLPDAVEKGHLLSAPCPFCTAQKKEKPGKLMVHLNPESYFRGYFRCTQRCVPGGFHLHFSRLLGVETQAPGFDPDREAYVVNVTYPSRNLNAELEQFLSLMGEEQYQHFAQFGVSQDTVREMKVGFNGRYLVYPYIQQSGYAYAARCVIPDREHEQFWHGNENFAAGQFRIYNVLEIERCQGGALFITEGELNLLILKELGYPAISVPTAADLEHIATEQLEDVAQIFILVQNTPEARLLAREMATRLGFKARILVWPAQLKRGQDLSSLATSVPGDLKKSLAMMIKQSKSFSPFSSPGKEGRQLAAFLEKEKGKTLLGLETGFAKLNRHLEGLRGINILGGPPKAGKSCFFMQISTDVARLNTPVIYYDFENGRQKIYLRTLVRTSGLEEKKIRQGTLNPPETESLKTAWAEFDHMLRFFRVVTDRKLTPDIMRRHIDFIKHETRKDELLIVIDSLHKLPFKDLTERRTGIDSWLRILEALRDEQQVCFLVISELTRGKGGGYDEKPDLASFKESGDIEYSADNAMVLVPNWDPLDPISTEQRRNNLWVVASRENTPGLVAEYRLEYPYWRFQEL